MNNKTKILIAIGGAATIVLTYFLFRKNKISKEGKSPVPTTKGHTSEEVIQLLNKLNQMDMVKSLENDVPVPNRGDTWNRWIWVADNDLRSKLGGIKQTDIDSLFYVFNQKINGKKLTQVDFNFINNMADKIGL